MCATPCHEGSLRFPIDYCCDVMNMVIMLDHIVEPFDQKDCPGLGKPRAKIYAVRTRQIRQEDRCTRFALGDLREVIDQFVFLDDEKMIAIGFDQSQVAKSLHEEADPRPRRAYHRG